MANGGFLIMEPVAVQKERWTWVQEVKNTHLGHMTQKLEKYFKKFS